MFIILPKHHLLILVLIGLILFDLWNHDVILAQYKRKKKHQNIQISVRMACSKLNKVEWDHHVPTSITSQKIMEVCYISYPKACSIEIIDHLLGGPNLEFKPMELENLFDCYKHCKDHLLDNIKKK